MGASNLMDDLKNNRAPFLYYIKLCASFQIHRWLHTGVTVRKRSIQVKIWFCCPMWPWNLMNDLEKIGHLFYATSSFVHHFKAIGKFWERSIRVKIGDFLYFVTLKFDRWPGKTIGHPSYVASSFVHHFVAISEFYLELQSGNAQFGSKLTIFLA